MGYCIFCPFYISDKKHTISCEDSIHIFYESETKKNWMKKYCRGQWKLCKFARALNNIYELEEKMSDWVKKAKLEEQKAKSLKHELKNLNREYGKRVSELDCALRAKEATRKAAEHIIRTKEEQIKTLKDEAEGWRQLHELDQATIACLMQETGTNEFDGSKIRPFREKYEYSFSGKEGAPMLRKLHLKTK